MTGHRTRASAGHPSPGIGGIIVQLLTRVGAVIALAALSMAVTLTPAAATTSAHSERAATASAAAPALSFTDVTPGTSFYTEIMWLADQGVSTGWTDGTFRPFQPVTRDAMAAFMYRLAGSPSYSPPSVSPFSDVPTTYQFYTEISWLADQGITTGWTTPNGREFRPWSLITRDAMAAFLYRYKGMPAYSPVGASPFLDVTPSSSFYTEIRWLAAQGISTGWDAAWGCRSYQPFGNVARDAMAAFMYRATVGGTTPVQEGTCSPPPGPAITDPVTPGAYCAQNLAGWYGYSAQGVLMRCTTSLSDDRLRWRAV